MIQRARYILLAALALLLATLACNAPDPMAEPTIAFYTQVPTAFPTSTPVITPLPTRPAYNPGELVDYIVQTGDTLPALAARFNTSEAEILAANDNIPREVTTLPPGMPMQIPIYYLPFWGSPYRILPDSHFVNGPLATDFDTQAFVNQHSGWLKDYSDYVGGKTRTGAQIVDYVATNFSVSPRVLLALLEYQAGALSSNIRTGQQVKYPLGYESRNHQGVYLQLVWAANKLNNGYYGWREGSLLEWQLADGRLERPDPWQNAASVALQNYFNIIMPGNLYPIASSAEGFAQTYVNLFGDPWKIDEPHIPVSLEQPELLLPWDRGKTWAYTGGPHTGWGTGEPFAALDFAPQTTVGGCGVSEQWATAMASGVVVRSEIGIVILDLDGDGDERTGWNILYLHLATKDRPTVGTYIEAGGNVGHPSCEGGTSTGTHIHIARKYNGEWIMADGPLAFNMEGWVPQSGTAAYKGTLTRFEKLVTASSNANQASLITSQGSTDRPIGP
ncbi:MAG: LysM peptidoglycan-binding domain-containing protein [Anaerolineales bacterium]|nr:LysM peptidoglycan-binding domain-containing protein [Anaerolineales bacterium]